MDLKERIKRFIEMYDGTAIGQSVKNMLDNGTQLESICEYADIDFEEVLQINTDEGR